MVQDLKLLQAKTNVHRHLKWLCFEYTSPVTVCILGLLGQVHLKCFRAALGQQKESESSVWMDECFRAGRVNGWHSCALLGWPTSLPHGLAGWVDRSDPIHLKLCFHDMCFFRFHSALNPLASSSSLSLLSPSSFFFSHHHLHWHHLPFHNVKF